ncbi:MAG: serine/threonine-protein kinase [Opitutales bacterium]
MEEEYSTTLKCGSVLAGKYRVDKLLGEGGFGAVYKAYDTALDRYVALKECLPCDFAARSSDNTTVRAKTQASVEDFEWAKTRFVEEARTLAKFKSTNLLSANNVFQANGTVYMDSDFIEGKNLEDILATINVCPEKDVLHIFKGILNGLKEVHILGLMHRDIKPANIIIRSSDKEPVLIDFGSARMAVTSKTKPLTAMVTQGYAPLEQYYEDGNQGAWTDIYALAGVCYKMITGEKPPEAVARVSKDNITKLAEVYKGKYSDNLLKVLDNCLLMEEAKRPQSVDEIFANLNGDFNSFSKEIIVDKKFNLDSEKALIDLAKQGDAIAQNNLGDAYYDGDEISKSYDKAVSWYAQSAELGNADAQNSLAICYYFGNGVSRVLEKAASFFEKSAEQGNADAQYNIGVCYYRGIGVARNYAKAISWFEKSAEQGNSDAQNNLGLCYYMGNGIVKDYFKAVYCYKKAAQQNNIDAQNNLGLCYYLGHGVDKDYKEAAFCFDKAAYEGYVNAIYNLGICFFGGRGVVKDEATAVLLFDKAATQGDVNSMNNLGLCFEYGYGVEEDHTKAIQWYEKAIENGSPIAEKRLKELNERNKQADTCCFFGCVVVLLIIVAIIVGFCTDWTFSF